MKKLLSLFVGIMMLLSLSSCGYIEGFYDESNYESLTNETGDVYVISGGKVLFTYLDAKIKYSSSDTQAMWIVDSDGEEHYLQGECVIDIK